MKLTDLKKVELISSDVKGVRFKDCDRKIRKCLAKGEAEFYKRHKFDDKAIAEKKLSEDTPELYIGLYEEKVFNEEHWVLALKTKSEDKIVFVSMFYYEEHTDAKTSTKIDAWNLMEEITGNCLYLHWRNLHDLKMPKGKPCKKGKELRDLGKKIAEEEGE